MGFDEVVLQAQSYQEPDQRPARTHVRSEARVVTAAAAAISPKGPVPEVVLAPTVTVDSLLDDLSETQTPADTKDPASWGQRGRINRVSMGLLRLRPATDELAYRESVRLIRQTTFSRAVYVAIANPKGGIGKTTTALCLANELAWHRGGKVMALEATDARGTLARRAEGSPSRGVTELLQLGHGPRSAGELAGFLAPQTSHASVLGTVSRRSSLTPADVEGLVAAVDPYFEIVVIDTANDPESAAFRAAMSIADALVVPTAGRPDSVFGALDLLSDLSRGTSRDRVLAANALVLDLDDGVVRDRALVERLHGVIEKVGTSVVTIPFDEHLAPGKEITRRHLSDVSRHAWTKATADSLIKVQETTK
ncbi:MinD/ParA family ATP-binding protein [Rathayibacter rathayi]|nr:AAA family ATPase [Rathayibacter rathayi]SOE06004.1 Cellulose biosynthesis protein BcsQ [Rathayibacter rathayi NCPPB 2980 = VKM Ac-1601]